MKTWHIMVLCNFYLFTGNSQAVIEGKVWDGKVSLPGASVLLETMDSVMLAGTSTDVDGKFIFKEINYGTYRISVQFVGYTKYLTQVELNSLNAIHLEITLSELATNLNEVEVSGQRLTFEHQQDRLVMNIEGSVTSTGSTMLDVLQKLPGVVVNKQSNSILMNGKNGVRIMINGRVQPLSLDAVMEMLDGMNSSNVEKVELISIPPSKYDADGGGGMINIITKEQIEIGTSGNAGLILGYRTAPTLGTNLSLNHRSKKFGYSLDYSIVRNQTEHISRIDRTSSIETDEQTVRDFSPRQTLTIQNNLNATLEWQPNQFTKLWFGLTENNRNWTSHAINKDEVTTNDAIIATTQTQQSGKNLWKSVTSSIGVEQKINHKSTLSLSADYLHYVNDNPSQYINEIHFPISGMVKNEQIDLVKKTPINFVVLKSDYQFNPGPLWQLEAGVKWVKSDLTNNVIASRNENNMWATDSTFTSASQLHEHIGATYVSAKFQAPHHWLIKGGLRYEHTHTVITDENQLYVIDRNYGYWFPTINVQKQIKPEREIQFSYTRRMTRPTYNEIAPYVFFWGPNTFTGGNPQLYPAVSDGIKFGYHSKNWNISATLGKSKREIARTQPNFDTETGNVTYTSRNLQQLNSLVVNNAYSIDVTRWWSVQSNVSYQYFQLKDEALPTGVRSLNAINLNLVQMFTLPKNYTIELSGFYQSKILLGVTSLLDFGSLNIGVQKKLNSTSVIRLSVDDLLYTNTWRQLLVAPGKLKTYWYYDYHNQFFRITYSYKFGQGKQAAVKNKSGADDEVKRVAN